MVTSYELERQLKEVKEAERVEVLQIELTRQLQYKGKCYSTHLLGRGWHKNITCNLRRVADVVLNDQKTGVYFHLENIEFKKSAEGEVSFHSFHTGASDIRNSWESFRHEITEAQFMTVKAQTEAYLETIGTTMRSALKEPIDYIDGFQQKEDQAHEEILRGCIIPLITLPSTSVSNCCGSIAEMLSWNHHPFLYCGKYLVNSKESKNMVNYIIKDLTKHMNSWGGSIYERDAPRVRALTEFVNGIKWLS